MVYHFRDHLGQGSAPLADIESAISSGTLSPETLVSANGQTWQSVETAKQPPPLPPQPAKPAHVAKKKKRGCGVLVIALIVTFLFVTIVQQASKSPEDRAEEELSNIVRGTAIAAVKARLKDGKGADFDMQSIGWSVRKDGAYEITGEVRASNSFGAMLNNEWRIVMRQRDAESWTILYAKIGDVKEGIYPPDTE